MEPRRVQSYRDGRALSSARPVRSSPRNAYQQRYRPSQQQPQRRPQAEPLRHEPQSEWDKLRNQPKHVPYRQHGDGLLEAGLLQAHIRAPLWNDQLEWPDVDGVMLNGMPAPRMNQPPGERVGVEPL